MRTKGFWVKQMGNKVRLGVEGMGSGTMNEESVGD